MPLRRLACAPRQTRPEARTAQPSGGRSETGAVSEGQFLSVVRAAAQQAGRRARVLELSGPAPDHPVALDFPEGRYLKVALLHVE